MDVAAILGEIDAELQQLRRVREILETLCTPVQRAGRKSRRKKKPVEQLLPPAPTLVVLPPRPKREYRPRVKPIVELPRALAPAPFDRPVFVPKAALPTRVPDARVKELSPSDLEEAVRRNLLGGAA